MHKKYLIPLTVLFAVVFAIGAFALDGSGTLSEPYTVTDAADFAALASLTAEGKTADACFLQTADIDFGGAVVSVGTSEHPFEGVYDGNGFKLDNARIDTQNGGAAGLFAYAKNASFLNVRAGSLTVTYRNGGSKEDACVGGLCGKLTLTGSGKTASFAGCTADGSMSVNVSGARVFAGMLCGLVTGDAENGELTVDRCAANADIDITSDRFAFGGGLIGMIELEAPGISMHIDETCTGGSITAGNTASMTTLGGIVGMITYENEWSAPLSEASLSASETVLTNSFSLCTLSLTAPMQQLGDIVGYSARAAASGVYTASKKTAGAHPVCGTVVSRTKLLDKTYLSTKLGWDTDSVWTVSGDLPSLYAPHTFAETCTFASGRAGISFGTYGMPKGSVCIAAFYDGDGRLLGTSLGNTSELMELSLETAVEPASVKLFFVKSTASMRPVCSVKTVAFAPVLPMASAQAYTLCYTRSMDNAKVGLESGWTIDNRAGTYKASLDGNDRLIDFSTEESSRMIRRFNHVENDVISATMSVNFIYNADGIRFRFMQDSGSATYEVVTANGYFNAVQPDGSLKKLCAAKLGKHTVDMRIDLAGHTAQLTVDGTECEPTVITSNAFDSFEIATETETTNVVVVGGVYMYGNYCMTGKNLTLAGKTSEQYTFEPASGKISADCKTFFPNGTDGLALSLTSGGRKLVTVSTANGTFYVNGTSLGKTYTDKLWYSVRLTADTASGKATVYINSQQKVTVGFLTPAAFVDGCLVEGTANSNGIGVSGLAVFPTNDYEVPEPVSPPGDGNYLIGVNVCPLWKNGEHWGWSAITPYNDFKPVLGYYDEGSPETADWEIKYLVDHGIDFQAFCWYAPHGNAPIQYPNFSSHLNDGYLYAKNKDKMEFCLIWECSTSYRPTTEQDFYDYFVPYWMEYYFSNDNYVVFDNGGKGLLPFGIFGMYQLIYGKGDDKGFGTRTKAMFSYLNEQVKTLGYDGVLILVSNDLKNDLKDYGADGWFAYNWGTDGTSAEKSIAKINSAYSSKDVPVIPTASVGFNNIPWNMSSRSGLISTSDFRALNYWIRDTYLPSKAQKDSIKWNDKLVWLSNWNEYGEGTYLMPCEGNNGFGYLDQIRWVYCTEQSHTDPVPDEEQLARITHAYPQNDRLLMSNGYYTTPTAPAGKSVTHTAELYVDNVKLDAHIAGVVASDGVFYYPFEPIKNMINYRLFVDYDWNCDTKKLTLRKGGHSYTFTVGSDTVVVDGAPKSLGAAVYAVDNVPMLPMKQTASLMGMRFLKYGNDFMVETTAWSRVQTGKQSRRAVTGNWDFEGANSLLGFTMGSAYVNAAPDYLHISYDAGTDPSIFLPDTIGLACGDYPTIEICYRGVQNGRSGDLNNMGFFFITNADTAWNESKHVVMTMPVPSGSGKDWQTIRFDMSANANWKGTLKRLRFDMFEGGTGWLDVKYIRLLDKNGNPVPGVMHLKGGTADADTNAFFAGGSTLTVVNDADTPANPVYQITSAGGKKWTYFMQNTTFTPGKTYRIEYDVRVTGVGNPSEGQTLPETEKVAIFANLRYADPAGSSDHVVSNVQFTSADGWVHYCGTITVKSTSTDRSADQFAVFANPYGEYGVNYQIDNIVVTEVN